jgi:hypothetical protein
MQLGEGKAALPQTGRKRRSRRRFGLLVPESALVIGGRIAPPTTLEAPVEQTVAAPLAPADAAAGVVVAGAAIFAVPALTERTERTGRTGAESGHGCLQAGVPRLIRASTHPRERQKSRKTPRIGAGRP